MAYGEAVLRTRQRLRLPVAFATPSLLTHAAIQSFAISCCAVRKSNDAAANLSVERGFEFVLALRIPEDPRARLRPQAPNVI
jgi:hypothetical protein